MGWSCRTDAGNVLRAWSEACIAQTGSQNVYKTSKGKYFYEVSRTEHYDGAITGSIMKVTQEDGSRMWCKRAGSFRIEGDGTVARGPKMLKEAAKKAPKAVKAMPGSGGPAMFQLI